MIWNNCYIHDILIIVSELNVCLTFGKFLPYYSITQTSTLSLWDFAGTGAKDLSIGIQCTLELTGAIQGNFQISTENS
jgi:hypothetical protein